MRTSTYQKIAKVLFLALVAVGCKSHKDQGVNVSLDEQEAVSLATNSRTTQDDPPPEEEGKPGDTGTAMALEEGKMGKKDSVALSSDAAVEQARNAGVLGSGRY